MSVYTKKGDDGNTSLVGGQKVSKSHDQIDVYGEVDELNSHIGFLISLMHEIELKVDVMDEIQHALFDLGSNLACHWSDRSKYNLPTLNQNLIQKVEAEIDFMDERLPQLRNFILPRGSKASSHAHICRTVSRRVERKLVKYAQIEQIPGLSLELMNRLSDYFFVLSRYINYMESNKEIIWKRNV